MMYTLLVETVPSVTKRRIDLQAETLSDFRAKLLAETRVPDTGDNVQLEYFDADFGEYALLTDLAAVGAKSRVRVHTQYGAPAAQFVSWKIYMSLVYSSD